MYQFFVKVFGSWSIFVIFMKEMFSCYLFLAKQWYSESRKSNFPSLCINSYNTPLLLGPQTRQYSFRYGIDEVLGIWYDLNWYFWPVFLWIKWNLFGQLFWWQVLPKFLLTIWYIMELAVDMYTSAVSRVLNTSSIMKKNTVESWCLCGNSPNFLYSCWTLVM